MTRILRRTLLASALVALEAMPAVAQSTGSPELDWYGYVKLDASWDEAIINSGNFARWVNAPEMGHSHADFNMTARQTRLGFRATSQAAGAQLTGRWEADFYAGADENKNALQVRHAYVDIVWPSGWEVLAGQTSDVISPLNPSTLNYVVAWWAGNIGYRRPQLRVTRRVDVGSGTVLVQGAASRTIGDDWSQTCSCNSGAASGVPTLQGLAGFTLPVGGRTLSFGAYGHHGREHLGQDVAGGHMRVNSSSVGGYLQVPLGALTLSGEGWVGSNMDEYLGGIGQGLNFGETSTTVIDGKGVWGQIGWAGGDTRINIGSAMDNPDNVDLAAGARSRNVTAWGNVIRDLGGGLQVGLEYSWWQTRYIDLPEGTSSRVQGSVIYSF
jgi:hypothetical protein